MRVEEYERLLGHHEREPIWEPGYSSRAEVRRAKTRARNLLQRAAGRSQRIVVLTVKDQQAAARIVRETRFAAVRQEVRTQLEWDAIEGDRLLGTLHHVQLRVQNGKTSKWTGREERVTLLRTPAGAAPG